MKKLNARSVKSRQNSVLRYVASTDIDRTARDLNVSTRQLKSFLRSNPQTVEVNQARYQKLLSADAKAVAKQQDVKLVPNVRGKRLSKAFGKRTTDERMAKAVRLANATRERYKSIEGNRIKYRPLKPTRVKAGREQIINNMAGLTQKSILNGYNEGLFSDDEARTLMRKLYRNSGLSNAQADGAWRRIKG